MIAADGVVVRHRSTQRYHDFVCRKLDLAPSRQSVREFSVGRTQRRIGEVRGWSIRIDVGKAQEMPAAWPQILRIAASVFSRTPSYRFSNLSQVIAVSKVSVMTPIATM